MSDYVSEIRLFPWNWAPKYWALCNGALLSIQQNQALFALIGTTYGGDGVRTFGLPDLRGRAAIHYNSTYLPGAIGGQETVTLTSNQLPQHSHLCMAVGAAGNKPLPTGHLLANNADNNNYYAPPNNPVALNQTSIANHGEGLPHENMQPFLVLNYCICTQGVFPSRN